MPSSITDNSERNKEETAFTLATAAGVADELLARAKRAGADAADVLVVSGASLGASCRLGKLEDVERSEGRDIGLRVFIGKRQAVVSSSDTGKAALEPLVERAIAMARAAPEDPHCGLAEPDLLAQSVPDLDLTDPDEPEMDTLIARARAAEEAALAVEGVTNSEGAGAGWGRSEVLLATSEGFCKGYGGTSHSVSCSVLAGEGTGMERDYMAHSTRHGADLDDPTAVGRKAGEYAVRRLNPRKVKSQSVPVVFDPRIANGLLGHFAGAISGAAVARGTSFLRDRMGQQVFAKGLQVVDDPHRPRGLRSKPFDGEGVANRRYGLVEDGVLTTWLLDTASAHQLGLRTTGHAARGTGGPPGLSTTNLYMAPGELSPQDLMADIEQGFYVRELIGMGINPVTGDYSRGAAGFWIEKGEIAYPVSEITIAGNLKDMFLNLTPANDLIFRYGTNAPTVRIEGMTIAGS